MHNRPVHAGDQILEERDGGCAPLGRVGGVVDIVWGDVGQVGGCGVFENVELVNEVEEDGVLLARGGGLGRAEGRLGYAGVVVIDWVGEDRGESGESEREERGDVHGRVAGLVMEGE